MASQSSSVSREEAQTAFARMLIEKVRAHTYPSYTEMTILEQSLPPSLYREYLNVLLEKTLTERWPSTTMLRRIQRFSDML